MQLGLNGVHEGNDVALAPAANQVVVVLVQARRAAADANLVRHVPGVAPAERDVRHRAVARHPHAVVAHHPAVLVVHKALVVEW